MALHLVYQKPKRRGRNDSLRGADSVMMIYHAMALACRVAIHSPSGIGHSGRDIFSAKQ